MADAPTSHPWLLGYQTLIGVAVGFLLGEGSRLLRDWLRIRRLRAALCAECRSLVAQIPKLIETTKECVAKLRSAQALPSRPIRAVTTIYHAVIAELAPHLTVSERSVLHVAYDRLRAGDELLAAYEDKVADRLPTFRQGLYGSQLSDPIGTYMSKLSDLVGSYEEARRLLQSFLDGKPEDVFHVEYGYSATGADRMLAAPFEPLVPAAADSVEMVTTHERAIAIEVDPDFIPGAASRTAALIREGREGRYVHGLHSSAHYRLRRCRRNHPTNK